METERASDAKRSGGKEEEKAEEKGISALQLNRTKEGAVAGRQQPGIVSFSPPAKGFQKWEVPTSFSTDFRPCPAGREGRERQSLSLRQE